MSIIDGSFLEDVVSPGIILWLVQQIHTLLSCKSEYFINCQKSVDSARGCLSGVCSCGPVVSIDTLILSVCTLLF